MRDYYEFYERCMDMLSRVSADASQASGPEAAMEVITAAAVSNLGYREAATDRKGLQEGETDQYACGMFFVLPSGDEQILIAPQNYGKEQTHMILATDVGHPGWVIKTKQSLLLENTDDHSGFVKILQTFRGGSVVYAPIVWNDIMFGQIICAAQARNVMEADDLRVLNALAAIAGSIWMAHDGPKSLSSIGA